jgi:N-acetylmuramoyl-L-alanine amidase
MVHDTPRLLRCGLHLAVTLICAGTTAQAQTLATAQPPQAIANAIASESTEPAAPRRTRFYVGLSKAADYEVFALGNPNRIIIEVDEVKVRLPNQPKGKAVGLVKSFRAGLSAADQTRIVINVTEPAIVLGSHIVKNKDGHGQQLVVEIEPFTPTATASLPETLPPRANVAKAAADRSAIPPPPFSLGASGLQPPSPRPAVSPVVLAEKAFKPVIVIDPGHGGHDSGAIKNGAVEKEIVLAFGKILAKKLEATGRFKVLLTRDEDVFVSLGERVDFAEKNNANLFIAVHCDYADTGGKANGATIYSLRDSTANALRRRTKGSLAGSVLSNEEVEAVREASGNVNAVKAILADLADREVDATQDRTSVFARTVIENMGASTNMRSDPDKQAGFRVLKTAQFPSILIELAYVTNKQDAANLKSDAWRDKVSNSIMTAIDNYFSNKLAQLPM